MGPCAFDRHKSNSLEHMEHSPEASFPPLRALVICNLNGLAETALLKVLAQDIRCTYRLDQE